MKATRVIASGTLALALPEWRVLPWLPYLLKHKSETDKTCNEAITEGGCHHTKWFPGSAENKEHPIHNTVPLRNTKCLNTLECIIDGGLDYLVGGGGLKNFPKPNKQVGWKMTKYVLEKAIVFIKDLYQSNITKFTERNNSEPYNACDQRAFLRYFYLQVKVSPLKIALVEILLPKINRQWVGIRISWVENFCNFANIFYAGHSYFNPPPINRALNVSELFTSLDYSTKKRQHSFDIFKSFFRPTDYLFTPPWKQVQKIYYLKNLGNM